jgi:hypothetical protein
MFMFLVGRRGWRLIGVWRVAAGDGDGYVGRVVVEVLVLW